MQINLSNKVILVTGASRGIGKAIALQLGKSGATVAVHYNRNEAAAQAIVSTIGNNSTTFQADLSNTNETAQLFEAVMVHYGRLDVLVNNAGIAIHSPIEKTNEDWIGDWEKTMTVNLTTTALLCKLAIPHFIKAQSGIIINISSRAAFRGDTKEYLAYAASKGGMNALTRSIARAYGKDGIKAFIIAPGFTRTDMAQDFIDEYGEAYAKNDLALDELTEPKDIAPMITLLASGLADHATGTSIDFNAGSYVH